MKKSFVITLLLAMAFATGMAQNEVDALRYSRTTFGGTARYMGAAGAFGAIGADFSSLSDNPAGIGLYNSSELVITPTIFSTVTEANFKNRYREDNKYSFGLNNVGIVMQMGNNNKKNGWKNFQFGFGMNRRNDFNNRTLIEGFNNQNSLLTGYLERIQGVAPEDMDRFSTWLAYQTDVIFDTTGNYVYHADMPDGGVLQQKSITKDGSQNKMVFTFGANYEDHLYLGATIGVPYIRYHQQSTYTETDNRNRDGYFQSFTRNFDLETEGTGFNAKLGFIARPTQWLRLGGAIHSPTFYSNLSDTWSASMTSQFDNGDSYTQDSPQGNFDYDLETPWRAIGSMAIFIGQYGFVSADYEFVDYSNARLRSSSDQFFKANDAIRSSYTSVSNLRLGTEWVYDAFSIRGGYAIYGSPYQGGINDEELTSYTFGFGFREKDYFVDLAYVRNEYSTDYYLYSANLVDAAKLDHARSMFMITLGIRY
ncbi:MAG: hypothetical protein K9I94_01795 [Bacteroidales bacterium]|nr:hypothetical protein [Bacteroidales bacterium]